MSKKLRLQSLVLAAALAVSLFAGGIPAYAEENTEAAAENSTEENTEAVLLIVVGAADEEEPAAEENQPDPAEEDPAETDTGALPEDLTATAADSIFDGQDVAESGVITVTITMGDDGKLTSQAVDSKSPQNTVDPEELGAYTFSYEIPSSWTQEEQDAFRKIMESYAAYAVEKDPNDPNALCYSGVKYVTDPSQSGTPQLTDADKYCYPLPQYADGSTLDINHCWASQAANILWASGWASQATDPVTGAAFTSEDEVMTYLSSCFTDSTYNGYFAINWFFNGTYTPMQVGAATANRTDIYAQTNAVDGTQQHGLLTNYDLEKIVNGETLLGFQLLTDDNLNGFDKLAADGFGSKDYGVDVQFYAYMGHEGQDDYGWTLLGGHALTLTGLLYDENAAETGSKYKAILIADSDNDFYTKVSYELPADGQDATAKKATCLNSYTLYDLQSATLALRDTVDSQAVTTTCWYLPEYYYGAVQSPQSYIAVLRYYYSLEACTDQTMTDYAIVLVPTPSESSDSTSTADAVTLALTDDPAALAKLAQQIFSDAVSAELGGKSFILHGASAYGTTYEAGSSYKANSGRQYMFFANCTADSLGEITLDGKALTSSDYRVVACGDYCCIIFSSAFMQQLSAGQHSFTFSCEGFDAPTQMSVVVAE